MLTRLLKLLLALTLLIGFASSVMAKGLPMPLVDFDFVSGVDSRFTCGRTGVYYRINSAGNYESVTAGTCNAPVFDAGGTPARGIGTYLNSTNPILNNSMGGAVVGNPGTLPQTGAAWTRGVGAVNAGTLVANVAALTTVNGIDTIDLNFSGTTAGAGTYTVYFTQPGTITASTATIRGLGAFIELVAGNTTGIAAVKLQMDERTTSALVLTDVSPALTIATSGLYTTMQQTYFPTLSGGATVTRVQPGLQISYSGIVTIGATYRIGWPQIFGQGQTIPSPPIRTTNAAVAVASDTITATMSALGAASNEASYTIAMVFSVPNWSTSVNQHMFSLGDGGTTNQWAARWVPSTTQVFNVMTLGGVDQGSSAFTLPSAPAAVQRHCTVNVLGAAGIGSSVSVDGNAPQLLEGSVPAQSTLFTTLKPGVVASNLQELNGTIERMTIWQGALNPVASGNVCRRMLARQ